MRGWRQEFDGFIDGDERFVALFEPDNLSLFATEQHDAPAGIGQGGDVWCQIGTFGFGELYDVIVVAGLE